MATNWFRHSVSENSLDDLTIESNFLHNVIVGQVGRVCDQNDLVPDKSSGAVENAGDVGWHLVASSSTLRKRICQSVCAPINRREPDSVRQFDFTHHVVRQMRGHPNQNACVDQARNILLQNGVNPDP